MPINKVRVSLFSVFFTLFFGLTFEFGPDLAYGTAYTLDQNYCTTSLNGSWSAGQCTITSSFTINSGDSLTIPSGVNLVFQSGGSATNNGIINNYGSVYVDNGATITNKGIIYNYNLVSLTPGVVYPPVPPGQIINSGAIINVCAGSIQNPAELSGAGAVTACATINLSSSSGTFGKTIKITGANFGPDSTIGFINLGSITLVTSPSTVITDARGSFTATFTVPKLTQGLYTVLASDSASGRSGSSPFLIQPSLTISPTAVTVGKSMSVGGTGFAAASSVAVMLDGTTLVSAPMPVTDGTTGSFTDVFKLVPTTAGVHTLAATDMSSNSVFSTFKVLPSISLAPTSGAAGTLASVAGTGFASNSNIVISFNGIAQATSSIITTDSTGSFSGTFTVPALTAGSYTVTASDSSANSAHNTFKLT